MNQRKRLKRWSQKGNGPRAGASRYDRHSPHIGPGGIIQYLDLALQEAYKIGQKPVSAEMIDGVLAQDINGLELTLTRHGYSFKVVADLLNVRPAEIRSFLQGRLTAHRAQELRDEMLAAGIPL